MLLISDSSPDNSPCCRKISSVMQPPDNNGELSHQESALTEPSLLSAEHIPWDSAVLYPDAASGYYNMIYITRESVLIASR